MDLRYAVLTGLSKYGKIGTVRIVRPLGKFSIRHYCAMSCIIIAFNYSEPTSCCFAFVEVHGVVVAAKMVERSREIPIAGCYPSITYSTPVQARTSTEPGSSASRTNGHLAGYGNDKGEEEQPPREGGRTKLHVGELPSVSPV